MTRLRDAVWWVMDRSCAATGHRLWSCYNSAPGLVQRLWFWASGPWA